MPGYESNQNDYEENDDSSNKRKAHDYCKIIKIYLSFKSVGLYFL